VGRKVERIEGKGSSANRESCCGAAGERHKTTRRWSGGIQPRGNPIWKKMVELFSTDYWKNERMKGVFDLQRIPRSKQQPERKRGGGESKSTPGNCALRRHDVVTKMFTSRERVQDGCKDRNTGGRGADSRILRKTVRPGNRAVLCHL